MSMRLRSPTKCLPQRGQQNASVGACVLSMRRCAGSGRQMTASSKSLSSRWVPTSPLLKSLLTPFLCQSSLSSLQSSIDAQDWESATRHCARAMTVPEVVINGAFVETAVVGSVLIANVDLLLSLTGDSPLPRTPCHPHRP